MVDFAATGEWTDWRTATLTVDLFEGFNEINLDATTSAGLGNIDSISIVGDGIAASECPVVVGATIFNDTFWRDTSGTHLYSQGGGILQVGDTYYWYGVHYRGAATYIEDPVKNGDIAVTGITTYSSKDLVNWTHEATDTPSNMGGWFGRLGVAYNENTQKYVLISQTWNATDGNAVYFATSDSPAGGFVFDNIQSAPPGIANGGTGDQTIFNDDDGKAYMVSSSQEGRAHRYISPLRESDYLRAEQAIEVYSGNGREGNCMFKYDGTYYFCSSDLHGWNTSQTYCVMSDSIYGPWSAEFIMEGSQADYSHVTQAGFFIQVYGTEQTTIIYAGDRWADFAGNGIGFNQWVPLSFNGKDPYFNSLSAWTLNATTGEWSVAPENNWVLNPTFEADRIDVTNPRGWDVSNGWNDHDGRTGRWHWNVGGGSVSQSIENLPNGTYTLTVWAQNGSGAELWAANFGGSDMSTDISVGWTWTEITFSDIEVQNGRIDVGVSGSVLVDDFTLILQQ
ncbi:MAG: family 43 glycosylhydrolase [Deltaproteobacteria bacterium]|nr:family 43 glycosylhydrolase [Deltaproteobacteria bacterium]MBN2672046.1 family 43 glycosylhydrolase [Deltaproteobacteria bacterium]